MCAAISPETETAPSPAELYESFFVPAMFGPFAPVLLGYAAPKPGENVLDVGCGTGIVARTVAPMVGAAGRVTGIDPNPPMLDVARSRPAPEGAEVAWLEGSAESLPGEGYDVVVGQQCLQFVPDRAAAAAEIARVTRRPGGRAAFAVWRGLEHQGAFDALIRAESRVLSVPLEDIARPFSFGDGDALRALFDEAGFPDVRVAEETRTVSFPDPDRFVELSLQAASAVIPELAEIDVAERRRLVDDVRAEMDAATRRYANRNRIEFPMSTNIVLARA